MSGVRPPRASLPVDLTAPRHVHVVAVAGYAMSAIARYLTQLGHAVSGCDVTPGSMLDQLAAEGISVTVGHDRAHLAAPCDFVSVATAVRRDTDEIRAAVDASIPVLSRGDTMRLIAATKPRVAVVSGTHGKTSTTSMLTHVLVEMGEHPSFFIGGVLVGAATNARYDPAGDWLLVEGDESDHSFLDFDREAVLVTNVEPDHLDRWGDDFTALVRGFADFIDGASGAVVLCLDDPQLRVLAGERPAARTYGFAADAQVRASAYRATATGCEIDVEFDGRPFATLPLRLRGRDMAQNALGAFAFAVELGVEPEGALAALATFAGVGRRFQLRGRHNGADCFDDYAHTSTEVRTTLARAREGGWSRVVAVFQPHRYTRIARHWHEFATAFDDADIVVVTAIDPAFEDPIDGVSSALVVDAVRDHRPDLEVHSIADWGGLADLPWAIGRPGDCIVTLGCGSITRLHDDWERAEATHP